MFSQTVHSRTRPSVDPHQLLQAVPLARTVGDFFLSQSAGAFAQRAAVFVGAACGFGAVTTGIACLFGDQIASTLAAAKDRSVENIAEEMLGGLGMTGLAIGLSPLGPLGILAGMTLAEAVRQDNFSAYGIALTALTIGTTMLIDRSGNHAHRMSARHHSLDTQGGRSAMRFDAASAGRIGGGSGEPPQGMEAIPIPATFLDALRKASTPHFFLDTGIGLRIPTSQRAKLFFRPQTETSGGVFYVEGDVTVFRAGKSLAVARGYDLEFGDEILVAHRENQKLWVLENLTDIPSSTRPTAARPPRPTSRTLADGPTSLTPPLINAHKTLPPHTRHLCLTGSSQYTIPPDILGDLDAGRITAICVNSRPDVKQIVVSFSREGGQPLRGLWTAANHGTEAIEIKSTSGTFRLPPNKQATFEGTIRAIDLQRNKTLFGLYAPPRNVTVSF